MARVFLSYDRDDAGRARHFAQALEKAGHEVWWDLHIRGGSQFSKVIEEALKAADVVVVLWSANSIESAWVRDEAAAGRDSGRLVPVTIDGTEPPLGFRQFQTIDLSRWKRRGSSAEMRALLADIEAMPTKGLVATPPPPRRLATRFGDGRPLKWWLIGGLVIGLLFVALGLLIARPWEAKAAVPVVAIRPGDSTLDSRDLARGLLVGLGDVRPAGGDSLQLVDENSRAKPDLIIEVSGSASNPRRAASMVLLRGSDRQLLSSQDVEAGGSNVADLKASLTVSAAQLLGCATEALTARPLSSADLKLYLDLCGQFATVYGAPEPAYALVSRFEELVGRAPQFVPAWKTCYWKPRFRRFPMTMTSRHLIH